ncbi:MAG: hypothetical protein KatS3mg110_2646 [Pirellulaceae bacterium]|nr:MAG: hypothetical protein KatS3mg110_2646 [Pirellulaceae bacterium]
MIDPSDTQLEAYLDDALPEPELHQIEEALRGSKELRERLRRILQRRDKGIHSLGAIWRRQRVSCPTRQELAAYLAGSLPEPLRSYVPFHIDLVGCPYCQANLEDLRERMSRNVHPPEDRRQRLYASGVRFLRSDHADT